MTIAYETPFGTFGTWEAAADRCESADLDPCACIVVRRTVREPAR